MKTYLKIIFNFFGVLLPVNQILQISTPMKSKNILMICHGEISIPPNGWGAVEKIASDMALLLSEKDFNVFILNSKSIFKWISLIFKKFDYIFLHDDSKIVQTRIFWPRYKIVLFSHYGYAGFDSNWASKYRKRVKFQFQLTNLIVCLSPKIMQTFSKYIDSKKLILLPNGIHISKLKIEHDLLDSTENKLICLGKVEPRKMQFELLEAIINTPINIEFIGPIVDKRIIRLINQDDSVGSYFKGEMNRQEITKIFSRYTCLIHVSEAEADALVLYEAQLAGLSLILTENSIGSQDISLPWIRVIPNNFQIDDIKLALSTILFDRYKVSNFAKNNYDWNYRLIPLFERLTAL